MKRKQVYLDPEDETRIKQLAERMDTTESKLIRRAIREFLRRDPDRSRRPLDTLVGQCDLDLSQGSEEHDRLLKEARLGDMSPGSSKAS